MDKKDSIFRGSDASELRKLIWVSWFQLNHTGNQKKKKPFSQGTESSWMVLTWPLCGPFGWWRLVSADISAVSDPRGERRYFLLPLARFWGLERESPFFKILCINNFFPIFFCQLTNKYNNTCTHLFFFPSLWQVGPLYWVNFVLLIFLSFMFIILSFSRDIKWCFSFTACQFDLV